MWWCDLLDKQVQIYSLDTGDFYSNHEHRLHWLNQKLRMEKRELRKQCDKITEQLKELGVSDDVINHLVKDGIDDSLSDDVKKLCEQYIQTKKHMGFKTKKIKETKQTLLTLLENKAKANIESNGKHHVRRLREDNLTDKKIV